MAYIPDVEANLQGRQRDGELEERSPVAIADAEREAGEAFARKSGYRPRTLDEMNKFNAQNTGIAAVNVFTRDPLPGLIEPMDGQGASLAPQAMTGAAVAKDMSIHASGLAILNSIQLKVRLLDNAGIRDIKCHHYCFYLNEVHLYHVKSGRMVKFSRVTNVESVEEMG